MGGCIDWWMDGRMNILVGGWIIGHSTKSLKPVGI